MHALKASKLYSSSSERLDVKRFVTAFTLRLDEVRKAAVDLDFFLESFRL